MRAGTHCSPGALSLARSLARLFSLFLLSVSLSRRLPPPPCQLSNSSLSLSPASVSDLTDWKRKGAMQTVSKCGDAIGCRVKLRCNPRLASLSTTCVQLDVIGRIPVLLDPHKHRNNAAIHQGSLYAHQTQSCATVLRGKSVALTKGRGAKLSQPGGTWMRLVRQNLRSPNDRARKVVWSTDS